jgi:hypothetical protein
MNKESKEDTSTVEYDAKRKKYIAYKLKLEFPTGKMTRFEFIFLQSVVEQYEKENPTKRWNMWDHKP